MAELHRLFSIAAQFDTLCPFMAKQCRCVEIHMAGVLVDCSRMAIRPRLPFRAESVVLMTPRSTWFWCIQGHPVKGADTQSSITSASPRSPAG
jgi:hypothetical protein